VEIGLTDTVPPVAGVVCVLPLVPVIVIVVLALSAVTVKTEEFPLIIEVGLAVIVTVGAGDVLVVTVIVTDAEAVPPAPVALAV
jgi:hypothetical protein